MSNFKHYIIMIYIVKTSKKVVKAFNSLEAAKSYVESHSRLFYSVEPFNF